MAEKLPIIFLVDDDEQVLSSIRRDVRKQYRKSYRVLATSSANEALETLQELKKRSEAIALFLSDQRMPEMLGVDFLEQAKAIFPNAKRALLTAYSDTDAAIRAINDVQLDYYLTKPWDPPVERLYPVLDDLLDDWQGNFKPEYDGLQVLGFQWSPRSHEVKDYLSGNLFPYQWIDVETSAKAQELMLLHQINPKELPALFYQDGEVQRNPSIKEIATKLGRQAEATENLYDVAIIGAGPSGLAAAVYGASEGLKTLLIERRAPGGQAGTSSRIENYLGFPSGLSGSDLARRAITQATRFGAEFLSPAEVVEISVQDQYKIIKLSDGTQINAKAIVVTTGVDYRRLEATGMEEYSGAGVYYGAATTEAAACTNRDVYIVGGGNSAGQGAMYLSKFARNVYIVIRKDDLSATMSQYLIDQINATENIHLLPQTVVVEASGENQRLNCLVLEGYQTGEQRRVEAGALFIFIGAKPYTEWLGDSIIKNEKGYIITGRELYLHPSFKAAWKIDREPYLLETCNPGIFAAGDVRAGAMNRVASAVGEGAMTISFVHKYLEEV
ncbi:MAG: FAD-dependent oxidoreductase [Bacteroidota bacterium]